MLRTITTIAALMGATAAGAQSTAFSESYSGSSSGVIVEGANVPDNTPGLGGMVGSAGNCYPGGGVQMVGPGAGISIGGGRVDQECNTRMEMAALASIAGNRAAVAHACRHDDSMRETLVGLGLCRVESERAAQRPRAQAAPSAPDGLLGCSSQRIRISSRLDAVERQRAINWCKEQINARR